MQDDPSPSGERHRLADRLFHWIMAATVIALSVTAFLPLAGLKFPWLDIHWISGLLLTLAVLFHLFRVLAVHGLREMLPNTSDIRQTFGARRNLAPAKYDAFQKGYHWATALLILTLIATGLLMLVKIDTPFWNRDPSLMTDPQWGLVYVIHGLAAMVLLFLILLHVYFNFLPEHKALLKAMIAGRGPLLTRTNAHDT